MSRARRSARNRSAAVGVSSLPAQVAPAAGILTSSRAIPVTITIRMPLANARNVPTVWGMGTLLLLFIVLPATELALLIQLGTRIGTMNTIGVIIFTGMLGASLARWQGLGVMRQIQTDTAAGRMPAVAMIDGVIILLASALLVTPGILTDAFGFLCLVPGFRTMVRTAVWHRVEQAAKDGRVVWVRMDGFAGPGQAPRDPGPRIYDIDPERGDEPPPGPPRLR